MTKFAFVFPGQGSQTVGMLTELYDISPLVRYTFNEASNVLNYDLWKLVSFGPTEKLNQTCYAQPALLASSIAIYRIWKFCNGKQPIVMAGHSLGEYSALVCSRVLNFVDAIKLVELRGKLMQKTVPEGTGIMHAIIGLNHKLVYKLCNTYSNNQIVSPVIFNTPDHVVISGNKDAVYRVSIACKNAGAKRIIKLPISVPAHSSLMKDAAISLSLKLKKIRFNTPSIPIINNVDIKIISEINDIRSALTRQLYSPIRWIDIIKTIIKEHNITHLLEIGPGNVLTNLTKRINSNVNVIAINNFQSLQRTIFTEL